MSFVKGIVVKEALGQIAKSNDHKVTVLGSVAGLILAAGIDFGKLTNGDPNEIGKAVGAVVVALMGFYTNKPSKDSK